MKKRITSLVLALAMLLAFTPMIYAAEIVDSGECGVNGDNVTWALDSDGVLTISGTGDMATYYPSESPFRNNTNIKKVVIQSGVTSLANFSFYGCTGITDVEISKSVKVIGAGTFINCVGLVSITIPEGVTKISNGAFISCSGLESIYIAKSVIEIENPNGAQVFSGCSNLKDIYFAGTYEEWRNLYLSGSSINNAEVHYGTVNIIASGECGDNLTWKIDDTNTMTISGEGDMWDYTYSWNSRGWTQGVRRIVVENGVTSIGGSAFSGIRTINSVSLPDSMTQIGNKAFSSCGFLEDINFPSGLREIGENAFQNCVMLADINIPDNIERIGRGAFYGTSAYSNTDNWDDNVFYLDNKLITVINAPSEDFTVREGTAFIAGCAFAQCKTIKNISLPTSVLNVDPTAFVDTEAYGDDEKLLITNINVDSSNPAFSSIDGVLFNKDKSKLIAYPVGRESDTYSVPSDVLQIGDYAFHLCNSLKNIIIPDTVTFIGDNTFNIFLTIIGHNGSYAQEYADKYTNYLFDDLDVEGDIDGGKCGDNARYTLFENGTLAISGSGSMYNYAAMGDFYWLAPWFIVLDEYFDSLPITTVEISEDITTLGGGSLSHADIETINISKNISDISYDAFQNCENLNTIIVAEDNPSYCSVNNVLYSKDMTLLHTYAAGKTEDYYAIPDGVEQIGECAFFGRTNLSSITIPNTVTKISNRAFALTELSDIYYEGTEEDWNNIEKNGNNILNNTTIHYNATGTNPPQITVTPTVTGKDGVYTFNIQLENVGYKSCLITVLYDEHNSLINLKSTEILPDNVPETIPVTADDAATAKVFIWDSFNGMKPLCDAVEAEIEII